jgi:hypothetical protein
MIGLGVGIDYALFIVTRFRENRQRGDTPMTPNMLSEMLGSSKPPSDTADPGPQGRCVCGAKVTIADAREITLPNGRPGWRGYCPDCGAPLFAIRRRPKPL